MGFYITSLKYHMVCCCATGIMCGINRQLTDQTLRLLTEKIQSTQQGRKKSHNVGTRLLSGFLVSFASGVVEWNCWMKQQSNTQKQGALTAIQTGCLGALHGSQSLTALNR